MVEHSEFPWGPQVEPGLLTPLGVFGWLVAAALLVLLLLRARGGEGAKRGKAGDAIDWKYDAVAKAARHAGRADQDEVLRAYKVLREVIRKTLGDVVMAGGDFAGHLKALEKARSGERDDPHHGPDHGDDGHGAHGPETHAPAHGDGEASDALKYTLSVVATKEAPSAAAKPHHPPKPAPPPSLKDQLALMQDALGAFNAWWAEDTLRKRELTNACHALNGPPRITPEVEELLKGLK